MTSVDLAGCCARLAWIVLCLIPAQLLFSARLSNEKTTASIGNGFRVALTNARAQAATMSIAPGDAEGSPKNRHRAVDQWLYVLSGTGTALVNGKRSALSASTLLLIERKDRQEIKCTGRTLLRTLNFYVPPGYTKGGNELPRAKP